MLTKRHRRLRIEGLERRTMMAADLLNGMLTVTGTKANDNIQVQVAAAGPHAGELQVDVNGVQSFFTVAQVNAINIFGLGGNDQITVDDNVLANTTISGGSGNDTIKGGGGNDTIHGDQGNDTIHGDGGNDTIHGNQGNDSIWGGDDDDDIHGDQGNDTIEGEDGDDTCHGDNGGDDVNGGVGNDRVFGDNGKDSVWGGDEDDYVDGGNGVDDCHGGDGDDKLNGGRGRDSLNGDQGDNLLDLNDQDDDCSNGIYVHLNEFRTHITGPNNAVVEAEFKQKNEGGVAKTRFELEAEHLAANSTFNVVIDNVIVGQISTDGSGEGELEFSTNPSGGEIAFPINFPTIHAGSTIVVGGLQGMFVAWHSA